MRIVLLLSSLLPLGTACSTSRDHSTASETPASAPAPVASVASAMSAIAPSPSPRPVDAALDSACSTAVALTRDALHIALARDAATSFPAPLEGAASWRGCRFTGAGRDASTDAPDGKLQAAFLHAGWTEDLRYDSSGPDGTSLAMRRREMLCHIGVGFQEADIPDDTATPRPPAAASPATPYTLQIRCTRSAVPPGD